MRPREKHLLLVPCGRYGDVRARLQQDQGRLNDRADTLTASRSDLVVALQSGDSRFACDLSGLLLQDSNR